MAITVNIYYSGVNGSARKFAEEMVLSGVLSCKLDAPAPCRLDAPDFSFVC